MTTTVVPSPRAARAATNVLPTPAPARPGTAPSPARPAGSRPSRPARDPFVDAVRALGTLVVVALHWLMLDGSFDGQRLVLGNALASGPGWLLTWFLPLPLLFFAAGAAAGHGAAHRSPAHRVGRAVRRLLPALAVFAGAWTLAAVALPALGLPRQAVTTVLVTAPQPMWFLGVYLVLLALVPAADRALARFGAPRVLGSLVVGALAVDALRLGAGVGPAGWANVLLVWAVPFVAGLAWTRRHGDGPHRAALALGLVGGIGGAALLVAAGPYPVSMIGMPGAAMSNLNPPTAPVLLLAIGHVCGALLARDALGRWASGAGRRLVGWLAAHATTVYLWHLPVMFAAAGAVMIGLRERLPQPWGPDWWAGRPLWLGGMALLLVAVVGTVGRAETRSRARRVGPAAQVSP